MIDVVPFAPLLPHAPLAELASGDLSEAIAARDRFAGWAAAILALPCFLYGPLRGGSRPDDGGPGAGAADAGRTLPELRRRAFTELLPDVGPSEADPRLGAVCVGARRALVAYNLMLETDDVAVGRKLAAAIRSPQVRALAFPLEAGVQLSCNLVAPWEVGPGEVEEQLSALAGEEGVAVGTCELVGLVPEAVLEAVPESRRSRLGLSSRSTIEARLAGSQVRRPPPGPAC